MVARYHIFISLPDAKRLWSYKLHIPRMGQDTLHVTRPELHPRAHAFNGVHYWEINKLGYPGS